MMKSVRLVRLGE